MSIKQQIRKAINFPFMIKPFDSLLAASLSGSSDTSIFRKIIPANEKFKKNTLRYCRRNGIKYLLDISDYQAWLIFFSFRTDSSSDILKFVKEGDTFIDIGGNIGQTALTVANKLGHSGRVISFEPYPDTYNKFQVNLRLNSQLMNVEIIKSGLGEQPGAFTMYQDCITNSGANRISLTENDHLVGPQVIQITTLDIFLQENPVSKIDLIKIDVEGFEMRVLKGAADTIARYRPAIYMEVDENNLKKQGDTVQDVFNYLKKFHYQVADMVTGENLNTYESLTGRHTDIYCRFNESKMQNYF